MTFNIGDFIVSIMKIFVSFGQKLYDVINYKVNLSFVKTALSLLSLDTSNIPQEINLLAIIGSLSAGVIVILIIYNIFK